MTLTDTEVRDALLQFIETHRPLGATAQINFVNEGVYTSIQRMRTFMWMCPYGKFPKAASLELRGEWCHPVMMMNYRLPVDPDPPVIIVRDDAGSVLAQFKPQSAEHIHAILRDEVFDLENMQRRKEDIEKEALNKAYEAKKKEFLFRQRADLDLKLKDVIKSSTAATCGQDLRVVAQRLLARLQDHKERVYTDIDAYSDVSALHAFSGGFPKVAQAISDEIGRLVYAELMADGPAAIC